jgi:hypothetical protein
MPHAVDILIAIRAPFEVRRYIRVALRKVLWVCARRPGLEPHRRGCVIEPEHLTPTPVELHGVVP